MARGVVQSFCRVGARFNCWIDHARCREACLVGEAAVRALPGVWRAKLALLWRRFFSLVCRIVQSVASRRRSRVAPYQASVGIVADGWLAGTVVRRCNINPKLMSSH